MTGEDANPYDVRVRAPRKPTNAELEKAGRGGRVDVRSTSEFAGSNGTAPPSFFVVLRVEDEVVLFSIADLMNRPPRKYQ